MTIQGFTTTLATIAAAAVFTANTATAYSGEDFYVCNLDPNGDNFLALRSCGATRCAMLEKLGPDTSLVTLEPYAVRGWRQVVVQVWNSKAGDFEYGRTGWVYDKYICYGG
jgi:hypothetical protein